MKIRTAQKLKRVWWSRKGRMFLVERLEMYVSAGMTIDRALESASDGLAPSLQQSLARARVGVEAGQNLSSVLQKEMRIPAAIAGLIACGESSGTLAATLKSACFLMEREDELVKKCLSAMAYPIVIALSALALIVGLLRGIMPQIIPLLTGLHAQLPLITRIVMAISAWLMSYGIYAALGSASAIVTYVIMYRKIDSIRSLSQKIVIRIPIVGGLVRQYVLALFFQSFGTLVEADLPAHVAYAQAVDSVSLLPLKAFLEKALPHIRRGEALHAVFLDKKMPAYIPALVSAGEVSGNLGNVLLRIARIIDRELEHSLTRSTALIEPVMMIVVGGMVGAIALSIMMPIYDISKTLQQ